MVFYEILAFWFDFCSICLFCGFFYNYLLHSPANQYAVIVLSFVPILLLFSSIFANWIIKLDFFQNMDSAHNYMHRVTL